MQNNSDIAAFMEFHVWWPSSADPFYVYNTTENTQRTNYYGVSGVPAYYYDGTAAGNVNGWQTQIQNRALVESPISITLTPSYNPSWQNGTMGVQIEVENPGVIGDYTHRLRAVLTESGLGAAGKTWDNVMRDIIPSHFGYVVDIYNNQSVNVEVPFQIPVALNPDECWLVFWVQVDSAEAPNFREVLNAAKWEVQEVEPPYQAPLFANYLSWFLCLSVFIAALSFIIYRSRCFQ